MRIITLTLNPAIDVHAYTNRFIEHDETIADIKLVDAGGKGINISKALKENGIDSEAIIIVGSENKENYLDLLSKFKLNIKMVEVKGRIRENITIHDELNKETRLSFNGFKVDNNVIIKIKDLIGDVNEDTIIALSGSIPQGIDIKEIKNILLAYKENGAKIIIDSRSFSLSDLCELKPWLIKPNKGELSKYFNSPTNDDDDILSKANELNKIGIENIIVSLGEDGLVFKNKDNEYKISVPKIKPLSSIGAGDSLIAGFIYGYVNGTKDIDLLKIASAFGTAKCLNEGTNPPLKDDVIRIYNQIK